MSRGAKHRNAFDIFSFSVDDPPGPKPRPAIRPSRQFSVRMPSTAKGKLTTAERLKIAKQVHSQRLTQSIRRQKREREKAEKVKQEAYRTVLVRRKEDPNLVWDLTSDAPVANQPTQPSQPDELVSEDDEDDQDFVQPIQPRKLFTSPELVKHVSRRPETSPLRHSATTHVTKVSDDDENVPSRSRLKKRRVDKPQKRIGLPINSAVFAPSVRSALSRNNTDQKTSARSVPKIQRKPLATVNGSRKASQHISKISGSFQAANAQRERTHARSEGNKTDHTNTSNTREMVLQISSIPPSDDEGIQEIHQISDDDFVSSHRDLKKQKDSVRGTSASVKTSRQALKRPRHRRELDTSIPAKTFYGKNKESEFSGWRRGNRVLVPLLKGHVERVPSKEIARLSLEEQESNPRNGRCDRNPEKANRRHVKGRIQYESSEEDDETTDSELDIRFKALSRSELETVKSLTFKVSKTKVMAKISVANIELKAGDFSGLRGSRWLNDEILNSFVSLINARNRLQLGTSSKENSAPDEVKNEDEDEDEIMEVAVTSAKPMEVFRRPRPQTHVFNTFFFSRLSQHGYDYNGVRRWLKKAGRDIKNLDLIMFPINLSNFHWVLAAVDLRGKQFLYLDSTYGEDSSGTIPLLRKWLHDEVADKHGASAATDMQIDSWGSIVNPSYLPQQRDGGSCGIFTLYMAEYLERGKRPDFTQENIRTLRQRTALFLKQGKLPDC